ncbi:ELO family [Trinorchestia longiramus]|nr:ELO family [Trinorchestia longiramus]
MDSYDPDSHIFQIITKFDRHGYTYTFPEDDEIKHYNMSDTPRQENGLYTTGYNCSYPYIFSFEENFDTYYYVNLVGTYKWMAKYFMLAYLGGIYFLKKYMKTRPRYDLQYPLVMWNIALALISLLGGVRALQELTQLITKFGFKFSMCFAGKA